MAAHYKTSYGDTFGKNERMRETERLQLTATAKTIATPSIEVLRQKNIAAAGYSTLGNGANLYPRSAQVAKVLQDQHRAIGKHRIDTYEKLMGRPESAGSAASDRSQPMLAQARWTSGTQYDSEYTSKFNNFDNRDLSHYQRNNTRAGYTPRNDPPLTQEILYDMKREPLRFEFAPSTFAPDTDGDLRNHMREYLGPRNAGRRNSGPMYKGPSDKFWDTNCYSRPTSSNLALQFVPGR